MLRFASILISASVGASCAAGPELIAAAPQRSDEPPTVVVRNVPPGETIRLTVERPDDWDTSTLLRSVTAFTASETGRIDTATSAPSDGSYPGPDPFGVFWTQARQDGEAAPGATPSDVLIRVDVDGDGMDDLTAELSLPLGHLTTMQEPFDARFPGAFVVRPESSEEERLPAIVVLGGSEGGDGAARALSPTLAALGYAVLGLPYYSPAYWGAAPRFPTLPRSFVDLPVDYVERAVEALRTRSDIDPDRIALHGASKGAELALLAATLIPDDSPGGGYCAVAAIVPSDVVWEGWGPDAPDEGAAGFSWRGEPLPFVPYEGMDEAIASRRSDEPIPIRVPHDAGRQANPDRAEAARINVAAIDEPVFAIGGDEDPVWDSGGMVRSIDAARTGLPTIAIAYPAAGHNLSGTALRRSDPQSAAARADAWPRLVTFLAEALSEEGCAGARD